MGESLSAWVVAALVVFWTMGAYNRLVRMRADSLAAFISLEALFLHYLTVARACEPSAENLLQSHENIWTELGVTLSGFKQSIQAARSDPLNGASMEGLRSACDALSLSADSRPQILPEYAWSTLAKTSQIQWQQASIQLDDARTEFNHRVTDYNEAISQFPAMLLVWVFGFKQAKPI